jgi:2-keto-4-pentenoate hydratase/2-oxohepta-3-ene-1,7-dioic acid hydratase in catechol pathway
VGDLAVKILRFNDDRIGILKPGDRVVDVSDVISHRKERGPQRVMEELIENFASYRTEIDQMVLHAPGIALADVKLLAPVPRPSKCLGAFVNYLDTPERKAENLPNEFFHKAPELLGPEGTVDLQDIAAVKEFNPEAELAFVIGKHAKNVSEADAMDYLFGYVPFFDVSARGLIRRTMLLPKGQDTFSPCGPWITTKDEISDPHGLRVRSWVNGNIRQNYSTNHMANRIPSQISWLSRFIQLQPGDVIATGTYHEGLGPINSGDILEIEIDDLGRARFFVKGSSPIKDTGGVAKKKKPCPLKPGFTITPV